MKLRGIKGLRRSWNGEIIDLTNDLMIFFSQSVAAGYFRDFFSSSHKMAFK